MMMMLICSIAVSLNLLTVCHFAFVFLAVNSDHLTWRCPTCQNTYDSVPSQYKCFCGKVRNPVWNNYDTPHSCGEMCGKKKADNCPHVCNEYVLPALLCWLIFDYCFPF